MMEAIRDMDVEMVEAVERRLAARRAEVKAREAQREALLKAKAESPDGKVYVAANRALNRHQRRKAASMFAAQRRKTARSTRRLIGQKLVKMFARWPFGGTP